MSACLSALPSLARSGAYPQHQPKRLARVLADAFASRAAVGALVLAALGPLSLGTAQATNFDIAGTSSAAQTLGTASNQTGNVAAGATLSVSGSAVAVTISGTNATLTNLGSILQTGTGRAIRDNTGVMGLFVKNGSLTNSSALIQTADADVIQMNVASGGASLDNYGTMISLNASKGGAQVVDFAAITTGANIVYNYAGALMKAYEADAVRPGVNGFLNNAGTILSVTTTGSSSDGVDMQNNSGAKIFNTGSGLIEGGRHGITGGAASATVSFTASISNSAAATIRGDNGAGVNLDGFNANQLVTIVNNGIIFGNGITGDGDGVDVDGLVNLTNTGTIRSVNAFSTVAAGLAYSEGITVGGGTIVNSGLIEGLVTAGNTNAVGRGISVSGNDITTGALAGTREAIYGTTVITNQSGGVIRGQTDSAIVVEGAQSGFTVTINNQAGGLMQGGGSAYAAIRTGLDNDTVNNAGTIDGSSSGKAIDLGAGNNTLNITGGNAHILGNISGGVGGSNLLTINLGAGNSFAYAGSISNFDTLSVQSGTVTLSGVSTYTGKTLVSGGTLVLDGANRLSASSALELNGGTLKLVHAGGVDGQTFASLALTDNSTIDLGDSALTFASLGTIVSGKTLSVLAALDAGSPLYALRFVGDLSATAAFQAFLASLSINGQGAQASFDGQYTNVTAISAVPEPESYALMLTALSVFGLVLRRKTVSDKDVATA
jgi:autotransporter-associated beta strand protein